MMAHGVGDVLSDGTNSMKMAQQQQRKASGVVGSRRIFSAAFKLQVLDSYRNDVECRGNQRATARKYGIHRRQIQKWLQCEESLRNSCPESSAPVGNSKTTIVTVTSPSQGTASPSSPAPALNLSLARLHGDELPPARHHTHPPLVRVNYTEYQEQNSVQSFSKDRESDQKYFVLNHRNYDEASGFNFHQLPYQTSMSVHRPLTDAGASSPSIKSEPASPDSVAPSSPAVSTTTTTFVTGPLHTDLQMGPGMDAVHFTTHVHDSEKPNEQLERVSMAVKEEIFEEDEPTNGEEKASNYEGSERSIAASPRITSSSSSANSSCSDSEIDLLDYSSNSPNSGSDSSRRRSFSLQFKLQVLDAFHWDPSVAGNQRATARKFDINRRQVQKWLGQEQELRGEIVRGGGDMRQRLGSLQDVAIVESPVDLRTVSSPTYSCDSSSQRFGYYPSGHETFVMPCCLDQAPNPVLACKTCYAESGNFYCYSPRDPREIVVADTADRSTCKRPVVSCSPSCYDEMAASSKRIYLEAEEETQDRPLCLVKPKVVESETVSSTVPTSPAKQSVILFKPYLDNPISKPPSTEDSSLKKRIIPSNNNNCHTVCNLNNPGTVNHDYAVEFRFKVPISWDSQHHISGYSEGAYSNEIRSAFVRYPAGLHYA